MTQSKFLQAIIASPEDDALRLVYADWLEERGDPRGEFIRAQCELAKRLQGDIAQMAMDYPQRKELKRRAEQLLDAHSADWNRPMQACEQWEYRRGACALASSPNLARLTELGLSGNLIGAGGWEALRSRFGQVKEPVSCGARANKPSHLTGAAISVSRSAP